MDAWSKNLTRIEDLNSTLRLRRVRRLLGNSEPDIAHEAYRDDQDRYILVVRYSAGALHSLAEWPKSLQVMSTWTDETMLAADDSGSTVTPLALTPPTTAGCAPTWYRCRLAASGTATATAGEPRAQRMEPSCAALWATPRSFPESAR